VEAELAMAWIHMRQGRHQEAIDRVRALIPSVQERNGPHHLQVMRCWDQLVLTLRSAKRNDEALEAVVAVLSAQNVDASSRDPWVVSLLWHHARILGQLGRYAEAAVPMATRVAILRATQSTASLASGLQELGVFLARGGDFPAAEATLREALEVRSGQLGPAHRLTNNTRHWLAHAIESLGRITEARALHREVYEIARETLKADDQQLVDYTRRLGTVELKCGEPAAAAPLLREALSRNQQRWGVDDQKTMISAMGLAMNLLELGEIGEARALIEDHCARAARLFAADHVQAHYATYYRGRLAHAEGDHRAAETFYRQALAGLATADTVDTDSVNRIGGHLAKSLLRRAERAGTDGRFQDAEAMLLEAHDLPPGDGIAADIRAERVRALIALYDAWHAAEPGEGHDEAAAEWRAKERSGG